MTPATNNVAGQPNSGLPGESGLVNTPIVPMVGGGHTVDGGCIIF